MADYNMEWNPNWRQEVTNNFSGVRNVNTNPFSSIAGKGKDDFSMGNYKDSTFGKWETGLGLGLKGFEVYNQYEAGETAKKHLAMQKEQMAKNWAATQASAQLGYENKRAQQIANTGVGGADARAQAEVGSRDALARYGLK